MKSIDSMLAPSVNQMYPIFLRPNMVKYLIIGAGNVATEKLHFLLKNSPNAQVKVVGIVANEEVVSKVAMGARTSLEVRPYTIEDIEDSDIIIAATNDRPTNLSIRIIAKSLGKLVNVADTPDLCDFYLGGVVTKGDLKIAISTNGKSPTLAKRLRQYLECNLEGETIHDLLTNLNKFRAQLKNDFSQKVEILSKLTEQLVR